MQFGQEYFCERGLKKTVCVVDTEDIPTMTLHFKLDFEERGALLHTRKLLFYCWSRVEDYEGQRFAHYKRRRATRGVG